jgi:hypothetical protein
LARFKSALLSRIDNSTLSGGLMVCSIVGVVFGLILLAAGYGLKINEITSLGKKLKEKFSAS